MNDPLFAVDGDDAALTTFIGATGDENFVVFADRDGADLNNISYEHDAMQSNTHTHNTTNPMQRSGVAQT
jgi:hypothetical protein